MMRNWDVYVPLLVIATLLLFSLISGKTFNPLRGMRPMIVTREERPYHYWASVILCALFGLVWLWMAWPQNSK